VVGSVAPVGAVAGDSVAGWGQFSIPEWGLPGWNQILLLVPGSLEKEWYDKGLIFVPQVWSPDWVLVSVSQAGATEKEWSLGKNWGFFPQAGFLE
jgi:hypothetical protein